MTLAEQINEVLARWDPIHVGRRGGHPFDEYLSYVPKLAEMLVAGTTEDDLVARLGAFIRGMGLTPAPTRDRATARELLALVRDA